MSLRGRSGLRNGLKALRAKSRDYGSNDPFIEGMLETIGKLSRVGGESRSIAYGDFTLTLSVNRLQEPSERLRELASCACTLESTLEKRLSALHFLLDNDGWIMVKARVASPSYLVSQAEWGEEEFWKWAKQLIAIG